MCSGRSWSLQPAWVKLPLEQERQGSLLCFLLDQEGRNSAQDTLIWLLWTAPYVQTALNEVLTIIALDDAYVLSFSELKHAALTNLGALFQWTGSNWVSQCRWFLTACVWLLFWLLFESFDYWQSKSSLAQQIVHVPPLICSAVGHHAPYHCCCTDGVGFCSWWSLVHHCLFLVVGFTLLTFDPMNDICQLCAIHRGFYRFRAVYFLWFLYCSCCKELAALGVSSIRSSLFLWLWLLI